ncbi:hypothetical protein EJB05_30271, partial [Eragrostis curvula]
MMQPPSSLRAAAITEPSSPMTPCFLRAADPLIGSPPPRLPPASSQVLWDARNSNIVSTLNDPLLGQP